MEKSNIGRSSVKIGLIQKVKKKFSSCSGETIAETLVSLLIAALALTMLAGAMSSSLKMVTKSRNKLRDYNEKNEAMAKIAGGRTGTITIESDPSETGLSSSEYQVQYDFNNEFSNTPVAVYKYSDPESTP